MSKPPFQLDQTSGFFPFRACRFDRRFAYGVYVPAGYAPARAASFRILVAVHGSERAPEDARALCVDTADKLGCIVLAPLFPVAVTEDEEFHNYIFLRYRDIRFDLVLLAMVDEVAQRFGVSPQRLWMAGFSGGGQFAHRFMYLHAARLEAVSIGAPGIVNTLDTGRDWFVGVRDAVQRFGQAVDWPGLRKLAVQVVVGGDDTGPDVLIQPPSPLYQEGVNAAGANRLERAGFLHRLLCEAGVHSRLDVVPGAGHLAGQVQPAVDAFFEASQRSSSTSNPL